MCGGRFTIAARSFAGVSPERTDTRTSGNEGSSARSSPSGPCRFFCTSFPSAFSGETYSTRVSSEISGPCDTSPSIADRNAASVLPDPVGAAMSTCAPDRMAGQPRHCGAVGSPNRSESQRWIVG